MNISGHISESLEIIFGVKILKFFDEDPDPESGNLFNSGSEIRIRNTDCEIHFSMVSVIS